MITYSNDSAVADRDVFVLGQVPSQSIARVIGYARAQGVKTIGAIVPTGTYGQRVSAALTDATRAQGIHLTAIETYDRGNTSAASAVRRVKAKGPIDALLIGDGARIALQAAPLPRAPACSAPSCGKATRAGAQPGDEGRLVRGDFR
jgi:outer membrane PBP1 activator LpoA protein